MKLIQHRKGLLAYTWSWYDENNEEISPLFDTQDQALDWYDRYICDDGEQFAYEG